MQAIKSEVKLEAEDKPQRPVFTQMFTNMPQRLQIHHQVHIILQLILTFCSACFVHPTLHSLLYLIE